MGGEQVSEERESIERDSVEIKPPMPNKVRLVLFFLILAGVLVVGVATFLFLGFIFDRYDATHSKSYVEQTLAFDLRGDLDSYPEATKNTTEEQKRAAYEASLDDCIDIILESDKLSVEWLEKYRELFEKIHMTCQYEVGDAVMQDENPDFYNVPVTVQKLTVFAGVLEDLEELLDHRDWTEEDYLQVIYDSISDNIANPRYEKPEKVVVSVNTSDEKYSYRISDDDFAKIYEAMLDWEELEVY